MGHQGSPRHPSIFKMIFKFVYHSFGKIPWWRAWQPTPVFLPGESHGQRSLVGCS